MVEMDVRIVELGPMRVASAHGYGEGPEGIANRKLMTWAGKHDLLQPSRQPRIFGFNNPDPQPGSPNYGYEIWMEIESDVQPEGGIQVKDFSGGLYAVTRAKGVEEIAPTWKKLVAWLESSANNIARHQWLEEHFFEHPDYDMPVFIDLYMPIRPGEQLQSQ